MRFGTVCGCQKRIEADRGLLHVQRLKQSLLHQLRVRLFGNPFHRRFDQAEQDILVAVTQAGFAQWLQFAEARQNFWQRDVGVEQVVIGIGNKAGALAEQMLDLQTLLMRVRFQLQLWHKDRDPIIPTQFAFLDQQCGQFCGESFRDRGNSEHRGIGNRLTAAERAHVMTGGAHNLAVADNRIGAAGNVIAVQHLAKVAIKTIAVERHRFSANRRRQQGAQQEQGK